MTILARAGGCLLALIAGTAVASEARADVSGWAHASGGVMGWTAGEEGVLTASPTMTIDAGMGSSPSEPFIVGGYFKVMPVFGEGVDIALMARFATRGFQTDYVGLAFDAGAYQRLWGLESTGFLGQAVLGLPLGFQLTAFGMAGSHESFGFGGTLGLDLVRLTVDRQHLLEWWPNPRPNDNTFSARAGELGARF